MTVGEELYRYPVPTHGILEADRRHGRELFDFAPVGYLVTDLNGVIREANRAAAELLNQSQTFLRGQSLLRFVGEEYHRAFRMQLRRLTAGQVTMRREWELQIRPYKGFPFPAALTVATTPAGEPSADLYWVLRNVSARTRVEDVLQRYMQRLYLLRDLDRAILTAKPLEDTVKTALTQMQSLVPWHSASLVTFDFSAQSARSITLQAGGKNGLEVHQKQLSRPVLRAIGKLRRGGVRIVENLLTLPEFDPLAPYLHHDGVCAYLGLSMMAEGELLGLFLVGRRMPGPFAAEHVEIVREIVDELVVAVWQARLREQVQRHTLELKQQVAERTAALRQERNFMSAVLDTAGALVVVVDAQGRIVRFNRACKELTGCTFEEVQGQSIFDVLIAPDEKKAVRAAFQHLHAGRFPPQYENHWMTRDGSQRLIAWSNTALRDADGRVEYIIAIGIDITERRKAEKALRENQARLEGIITTATDAIITVDADQRIVLFNRAATQVFGYPAEAVLGQPFDMLLTEDLRGIYAQHARDLDATHETTELKVIPHELWGQRADGTSFPMEAQISQLVTAGQKFSTIILRDITARKQTEEEKNRLLEEVTQQREQLRQFAQQIVLAQEEERRRIARELHDEAGQALTALKYSLSTVLSELPADQADSLASKSADLRQRLQKAVEVCETTMKQVRLIAHDLHPTPLDNVGLNLTLEGFCREFAAHTNLAINYAGAETPSLGDAVDITLYRFLQEALTNVAKHAGAKRVWVSLFIKPAEVSLSIEDDGRGFNPQDLDGHPNGARGLGLLGIRERLESLNGWLEIDSNPGQGTLVVVHIPRL